MDLIDDGAKAKANIWGSLVGYIFDKFANATGVPMQKGIKVLMLAQPEFHAQYGYSLIIKDIDPAYTIGEQARKRREIIERLTREGVIDRNKQQMLPVLIQRIAVISSATAAGYQDFIKHLYDNPYRFAFRTELFSAAMQGDTTESSILTALSNILLRKEDFDVVVIIRGGGAVADLYGFDSYPLALAATSFPLPIITGIGHERDETVLDIVAHTKMKTPTAVAAFIIEHQNNQLLLLQNLTVGIKESTQKALTYHAQLLMSVSNSINIKVPKLLDSHKVYLQSIQSKIAMQSRLVLQQHHNNLKLIDHRLELADPAVLMKRGYAIVSLNGEVVTSVKQLAAGSNINVSMQDGALAATINQITTS